MAVFEKVNTCARLMISCDVHLFILFHLVICFFFRRRSCYLSNKGKNCRINRPCSVAQWRDLMIGGLTDHNNVFPVDLALYSGSTFPSSPQRVSQEISFPPRLIFSLALVSAHGVICWSVNQTPFKG